MTIDTPFEKPDILMNEEIVSSFMKINGKTNSAASSMAVARDATNTGILALKGKIINCLSNTEEKIFENEEIKLLLSAMNIVPNKYNNKKLRYGKIGICVDGDADGYAIALLITSALYYLAPEFIKEKRLCWLKAPLYAVKSKGKTKYYFSDEEFNEEYNGNGEVVRFKGLGAMSEQQAKESMFSEQRQLEILEPDTDSFYVLENLMGTNVELKKEFVFNNVDFSEIKE